MHQLQSTRWISKLLPNFSQSTPPKATPDGTLAGVTATEKKIDGNAKTKANTPTKKTFLKGFSLSGSRLTSRQLRKEQPKYQHLRLTEK